MNLVNGRFGFGFRRWSTAGFVVSAGLLIVGLSLGQARPPATAVSTAPAAAAPASAPAEEETGYFVHPKPGVPRPPLPKETTRAFVIPIRDEITMTMSKAIERKIARIKAQDGQIVIFDFDTPGGLVLAAKEISSLIKNELRDKYTVAFVNSEAISAGALLALACNEIVMAPRGKLGDCAPIVMGGELKGVEREKIETYLRAEFRDSANANGYWEPLAESMVTNTIEVWLIQNVKTGEKRYVRADEWRGQVAMTPGTTTAPSNGSAEWQMLRVVLPAGQLLTMTTREAQEYGFARHVAMNMNELKKLYNITAEPTVLGDTWSEKTEDFLTSPAVTGILVLLAMFFGYVEMHTPGFGLAGAAALICLAVLFGSRYVTGLAQVWEIAVFAVGVVLVLLEVFVTPGHGVLGILGGLMCLVGLVASMAGNPPNKFPLPEPGLMMDMFLNGVFAVVLGFLGGCVLCVIAARYLPKMPMAGRLVLAKAPLGVAAAHSEQSAIERIRPGDRGVAESLCRPAGKARFGQEIIDVMSEGEYLRPGTPLVVVRSEGNRLVVRPEKQA